MPTCQCNVATTSQTRNLVLVNNVPSPPLQIPFMHFRKALWPLVSLKRTVTGMRLSSTAAEAWYDALAVAQGLALRLRHAIPRSSPILLLARVLRGQARPGPAATGRGGADSLTESATDIPAPHPPAASAARPRSGKLRRGKRTQTREKNIPGGRSLPSQAPPPRQRDRPAHHRKRSSHHRGWPARRSSARSHPPATILNVGRRSLDAL